MVRARRGDYGPAVKKGMSGMTIREPLGAALVDLQRHINTIKCNPIGPVKAPLPEDPRAISRHIKSSGYFLGADLMGICKLPQSAVYTHDMAGNPIEIDYEYAIVFAASKSLPTLNASNGYDWVFDPVSFQTYQRLACQTETMANYIRRLGYDAAASNASRYLTLMPQLVLMSGLGEISRTGIILNPFLGLNYKTAAVLTNLPLEADQPVDFGLQEYCRKCTICADQCKAKAIPYGDKITYNGYETWKLDEKKCVSFCALNQYGNICGRCNKVCPWNRPGASPRELENWDGSLEKLYESVDAQAEKIKKDQFVHKSEKTRKWWFDFEETDQGLVIPETTIRHFTDR
ncbi:MAG: 4Fe-4S dicluster domain-containing protein [Dehalococcoidales bacterium]|nr:4Fe-4S dicluster domain-containing protein [Dehalococcoidales bacterium]